MSEVVKYLKRVYKSTYNVKSNKMLLGSETNSLNSLNYFFSLENSLAVINNECQDFQSFLFSSEYFVGRSPLGIVKS